MSRPPLVIVHKDCFDGFTAAWVFRHFRGDAEFVHAAYGDEPPDCLGREVWVLDFSYPRQLMKRVILQSRKTTICDHHKTAREALDGILDELRMSDHVQREHDRIFFDMERSGAGIAYDVLRDEADKRKGFSLPGGRKLWLVDYVEDRDLWRFALPRSKAIAAWVAAQPMTFPSWDAISALTPEQAADKGEAVTLYIDTYGEKACAHAIDEEIGGHIVPTMNNQYMNCSEHLAKLLEKFQGAPFAASYFRRADGLWQFSLRSRGDFDVAEVAKKFGGGGHAAAAGFECNVLPWEDGVPGAGLLSTARDVQEAVALMPDVPPVSNDEPEEWLGGEI